MVAASSPQSLPIDPNYQMEAFLEYVNAAPLPLNSKPNVSKMVVKSLTLGRMKRRVGGYSTSTATAVDKVRLTSEPAIAGVAPLAYTSMCCNVDFACELHGDSPKSCGHESRTVAFGHSRAGGCSWKPGRTAECAGPLHTRGVTLDAKRR